MKKIIGLTFTVLTAVFLMSFAIIISATNVQSFTVYQSSQFQFVLLAGTTFNGSISVSNTIRFWVNAPDGAQIVNLGLIDQSTTFSFVAQQGGNYTLNFENDLPTANPSQVTFTYSTNPDISQNNNSPRTPLTYWLVIILIFIAGVILMVVVRYRNRNRIPKDYGEATSNPSKNLPESNFLCSRRAWLTVASSAMAFSMRLLMAWFRLPPK
jgi:hypothetical protein